MFYDQLQPICKQKGTSVSAVLDGIGMSRANVTRWKEGVNPRFEVKLKIANYLGINVNELLSDSEKAETEMSSVQNSNQDPDIRRIERARKNMPEKEKDRMMKLMLLSFEEYFDDSYIDEDTDE